MARERYLLNDEESTIHMNQIVPTTGKEKRANWWFHNKTKLIVGILITVCLVSIVWSIVDKEHPDYQIMMMTEYGVPNELLEDLEDHLEAYGEDLNEDGEVLVAIQHCCFVASGKSDYEASQLQAAFVRFAADAGAGDSMFFIYDDTSYNYLDQNDMSGFFGPVGDMENEYVLWSECEALKDLNPERYVKAVSGTSAESVQTVLGELKLSVRTEEGAAFDKEEKVQERADAIALFERYRAHTPVE